jgi:hypothetical protein
MIIVILLITFIIGAIAFVALPAQSPNVKSTSVTPPSAPPTSAQPSVQSDRVFISKAEADTMFGLYHKQIVSKEKLNYCMTIGSASVDNGAPYIMHDCVSSGQSNPVFTKIESGQPNQLFTMSESGQIINKKSNKCMAVSGANTADGSPVVQWQCENNPWFYWKMDIGGRLVSTHSGKCLTTDGSGTNLAKLSINKCTDSTSQKFYLQ